MELLFTYGSLQDKDVQLGIFARKLTGHSDGLRGYQISGERVYGQFPTVRSTGDRSDLVPGTVYEISHAELLVADGYEGERYKRTKTTLASGRSAWVYIGI